MKLAAHRGNRIHAPENTRAALLSGFTSGADVLQFELQLTSDGFLVLSADPTTDRLTGKPGTIGELTLAELKALDVSKTFLPRNSPGFKYRPPHRKQLQIETFPELLDLLPDEVSLLVELPEEAAKAGRGDELVTKAVQALADRGLVERTVVYSREAGLLAAARKLAPALRTATYAPEASGADQVAGMKAAGADGLVGGFDAFIGGDGKPTAAGKELADEFGRANLTVGAALVPDRDPPVPTEAEYEAARSLPFVWSLATASTFDVASFAYPSWTWLAESFAGKEIDTDRIWVGYAKANKYAHVYQDDGLHVDIAPYDGVEPDPPDEVHQELQALEVRTWFALTDWPFYSGGGLGVVAGIDGSFAAEIDFSADRACQATMCELAVTNVDPGANQPPWNDDGTPRLPQTIRNKAAFYNPHGAPPFVGSEHDEDDGYRINWNLGSEYDDNQYGRPVGDGTVLSGRFRLERRANFFAAYYRNTVDATDWVCVGAVRNDSMNRRVFLRCAGKRWRQELETDPTQFYPVVANHFVFKDLEIARLVGS